MTVQEIPDVAAMADIFTPLAVRTVATLNVADALRDGPLPVADLAARCGARGPLLARVLDHLVARGVFAEVEPGVFAVNGAAQVLYSDDPSGVRNFLAMDNALGRAELSIFALLGLVRSGEPAYRATYGRDLWSDLAADRLLCRTFADQMRDKSEWSAPPVAAAWDWSTVSHVVDVGGGSGRLLVEILETNPAMRGTLLDLPEVADTAKQYITGRGLADRCAIVPGSFFDPLPAGDLYLLCDVLDALDDDAASIVMRRCAEAAGATGTVLIAELVDTGDTDRRFFTEMDLRVLVCSGGQMRSMAQVIALATAAGLAVAEHRATPIGYSLLACRASGNFPESSRPT